ARAMNEVPLMCFSILALAILQWALWSWSSRGGRSSGKIPRELKIAAVFCPIALAVAINTKLTAVYIAAAGFISLRLTALATLAVNGWPRREAMRWAGYLAVFVGLTAMWSIDLNPSLYPAPLTRTRDMVKMRWSMQSLQREQYPEWALYGMGDKIKATHYQVA